jgi:hypothetical protein
MEYGVLLDGDQPAIKETKLVVGKKTRWRHGGAWQLGASDPT